MHRPDMNHEISVAPSGEVFALPLEKDYEDEFERLQALARRHQDDGRESSS